MIEYLKRLQARARRWKSLDADLNDRSVVELRLRAVVAGKKPPPDVEECNTLANKLGVPAAYRRDHQF